VRRDEPELRRGEQSFLKAHGRLAAPDAAPREASGLAAGASAVEQRGAVPNRAAGGGVAAAEREERRRVHERRGAHRRPDRSTRDRGGVEEVAGEGAFLDHVGGSPACLALGRPRRRRRPAGAALPGQRSPDAVLTLVSRRGALKGPRALWRLWLRAARLELRARQRARLAHPDAVGVALAVRAPVPAVALLWIAVFLLNTEAVNGHYQWAVEELIGVPPVPACPPPCPR